MSSTPIKSAEDTQKPSGHMGNRDEFKHPSRMAKRPGPLLRWLGSAFFKDVRFDDTAVNTIREASDGHVPVFVLDTHSLLDYLFFNFAFLRFALPLVKFAPDVDLVWFRPLKGFFSEFGRKISRLWKRKESREEGLARALELAQPSLLFLKRERTLIQWGGDTKDPFLDTFVELSSRCPAPITLIPLQVIWDQKPESYRRSMIDVLLGDPQSPGRLRKFLSFLRNFKRAQVRVGHPVQLAQFVANDEGDPATFSSRLRFALAKEFLLESKAIRGPVLKGAKRIIDEISRTPPFIADVAAAAAELGMTPRATEAKALSKLRKMAADFRFNWLETFATTIGLLFQRIFTGIAVDTQGLDAIREAARNGPIVLIPSHRSHMDYLVYSLVFYTHGLIPPHIAAGDNLTFWPMGTIFRRSGAFFIPRSIQGNILDSVVLRHYVRKLLKDGYWIEMFVEGTRSRTGKAITPRLGMLSMVINAVATGAAPDVNIVPAAVTYEKVVEEPAYHRESLGQSKTKENALGLARSAKVLATRYGRMYVQFNEPLGVLDFLRQQNVQMPIAQGESVPIEIVRRFAFNVMHRIDRCFVVTPYHLVAFALIIHRRRGIELSQLLDRFGALIAELAEKEALFADQIVEKLDNAGLWPIPESDSAQAIGRVFQEDIENVLGSLRNQINVSELDGNIVLSVKPTGRMALDYYKNGIIHFFVGDAILATALLATPTHESLENIRQRCLNLSTIFKLEFIYAPGESFEALFEKFINKFIKAGLIEVADGQVSVPASATELLADRSAVLLPFMESYLVVCKTIIDIGPSVTEKDCTKTALRKGKTMFSVGDIELAESVSAVRFKFAFRYVQQRAAKEEVPILEAARVTLQELELSP